MQEQNTTVTQEVEYRAIEGWPGYRVGNDGSVWTCKSPGSRPKLMPTWRRKKPTPNRMGHMMIQMQTTEKQVNVFVHTLVLTAFVGPRPSGMQCCHNDGNPANNRVENLRWDTCKSNAADRWKHGTQMFGEKHHRAKLTDADAIEAVKLHATGEWNLKKLGDKYGVTKQAIWRLLKGKTWSHLRSKNEIN